MSTKERKPARPVEPGKALPPQSHAHAAAAAPATRGHGHGHGHGHGGPVHIPAGAGHETSDADARPLVITGIVLVGVTVVTFALIFGLMGLLGSTASGPATLTGPAAVTTPQLPPQPRLEAQPLVNSDAVIAEQTERLESYGWISRDAGRLHIPIEEAMKLVVERGISAPATNSAEPAAGPTAAAEPAAEPTTTP